MNRRQLLLGAMGASVAAVGLNAGASRKPWTFTTSEHYDHPSTRLLVTTIVQPRKPSGNRLLTMDAVKERIRQSLQAQADAIDAGTLAFYSGEQWSA
jgi:hypothetical protein